MVLAREEKGEWQIGIREPNMEELLLDRVLKKPLSELGVGKEQVGSCKARVR